MHEGKFVFSQLMEFVPWRRDYNHERPHRALGGRPRLCRVGLVARPCKALLANLSLGSKSRHSRSLTVCRQSVVLERCQEKKMNTIGRPAKLWLIVLAVVLVTITGVLAVYVPMVRQVRQDVRRCRACDQLAWMRLVLRKYEHQHGTLPPLCLRNNQGKPIHSWRALILPDLEIESLKRLDLSQPWNSDYNRKIIENTPLQEWSEFARDMPSEQSPAFTHLFALLGADSIWDATTGLPKGTTRDHPNAILLISVQQSKIEPLQPGDITEDEVRKMVEDGQEVLFIRARAGGSGVVKIEDGRLAFLTWQEVLREREEKRGKSN